jgi:hypothetical protein
MKVDNPGFLLDRMGHDCGPLQFLRELTQNSIEAILALPTPQGEILWDVDWEMHADTGVYKVCITDTGIGMSATEMIQYINHLSSSIHEQSLDGNYGVGAKIAAATRNHDGLLYLSWKNGEGSMIHLWRDPKTGQYGLKQFERDDGSFGHFLLIDDVARPDSIQDHGTRVILLGNCPNQDTMEAPPGTQYQTKWIRKSLNTRYFQFPDGIEVRVREGWTADRSDTKRNVTRKVTGQKSYLDEHAQASGSVQLTFATAHWWLLRDDEAIHGYSGHLASSGHVAALYKNELYEMTTGNASIKRLQQFGIIFGGRQVVIYVEPDEAGPYRLTTNTPRTHLLIDSEPLPWVDWAVEFGENLPEPLARFVHEKALGLSNADYEQAIRDRLNQIRDLLRFSKYRLTPLGTILADPNSVTPGGKPDELDRPANGRASSGGSGGASSNIYALFQKPGGANAVEAEPDSMPKVFWITAADGSREPHQLEDRAASYSLQNNIIFANADFRGITDLVDRWCGQYCGVPGASQVIPGVVQEWFAQCLIETVLGVLALKGSPMWNTDDIDDALSESSLTAAVMARYHLDIAVKTALANRLGPLK